jgi:hypothetical protein
VPRKDGYLWMEDPVRHRDGHDVPAGTGTAVGVRPIDEDADLRLGQFLLAVDQVRGTVLAWIGIEAKKPRQAMLFEEVWIEGEGSRDTADRVTGPRWGFPHLEHARRPSVGLSLRHYETTGRSSTKDAKVAREERGAWPRGPALRLSGRQRLTESVTEHVPKLRRLALGLLTIREPGQALLALPGAQEFVAVLA